MSFKDMRRLLLASGIENVPTPTSNNECKGEINAVRKQIDVVQDKLEQLRLVLEALEVRNAELESEACVKREESVRQHARLLAELQLRLLDLDDAILTRQNAQERLQLACSAEEVRARATLYRLLHTFMHV